MINETQFEAILQKHLSIFKVEFKRELKAELMTELKSELKTELKAELDEQFIKFYKLIHAEILETHVRIDHLEAKVDQLYNLNDSTLRRLEAQEQERMVMGYQLGRHDGWIKQIAATAKVKLSVE